MGGQGAWTKSYYQVEKRDDFEEILSDMYSRHGGEPLDGEAGVERGFYIPMKVLIPKDFRFMITYDQANSIHFRVLEDY
jgi:hypothetical protein